MPGASTFAPSTSVNPGSDFVPATMTTGSPAGIADHVFIGSHHTAPGERAVHLFVSGSLPAPGPNRGRLARVEVSGSPVIAISDGTAWRALTAGDVL